MYIGSCFDNPSHYFKLLIGLIPLNIGLIGPVGLGLYAANNSDQISYPTFNIVYRFKMSWLNHHSAYDL